MTGFSTVARVCSLMIVMISVTGRPRTLRMSQPVRSCATGIDVVHAALGIGRDNAVADRLQRYLGPLLFFEDARLGTFAVGNIGDRALVCDDLAVVVVHRARILEHDDFATVLAAQTVLEILDHALRFEACEDALAIDRIDVQHGRVADALEVLGAVVAEHLDQRRIGRDQLAVARGDVDAVDHVLEQAAIAHFGVLELALVELAFDGDARQASHATQLVELIGGRPARLVDVHVERTDHGARGAAHRE